MLNRRSHHVPAACLAQLVSVIGLIMTNEDGLFRRRHTIRMAGRFIVCAGKRLTWFRSRTVTKSRPANGRGIKRAQKCQVPYLGVAGAIDPEGKTASLIVFNHHLEKPRGLAVTWHEAVPRPVNACHVLTRPDLRAAHGFSDPRRVVLRKLETSAAGVQIQFELVARSYTIVNFSLA